MYRRPSCYSCIRVNTLNTTTEAVIEKILEIQCDKRLQDTVKNGDIESLSVVKCEIPRLDYVVFVKGSGPHDIQYDYQQDRPPKEIIVSCKCAEAVLRGAQVSNS